MAHVRLSFGFDHCIYPRLGTSIGSGIGAHDKRHGTDRSACNPAFDRVHCRKGKRRFTEPGLYSGRRGDSRDRVALAGGSSRGGRLSI
jgi:hypothetical protein